MNAHHCCQTSTPGHENARRPASRWRRELAGWLVPGATLVLLPKCPACVVGYVALATGLGISVATAAHLRTVLVMLCMGTLAVVAGSRLRRFRHLHRRKRPSFEGPYIPSACR